MKSLNQLFILALTITLMVACTPSKVVVEEPKEEVPKFVQMKNQADSLSYALGVILQDNLTKGGFDSLDYTVMGRAMQEADTSTAQMSLEDAQGLVGKIQQEIQAKAAAEAAAEGTKFLAENAKKEGVQTTASGLQYKVLREGTGAKPTASNKVKVHYEGRLTNGKIFDSSYKRGEPISFGLGQVIRGWTEGLQLMPVGSKYELYIPYDLGYGERGAGANIPPYAALIFVVELLEFE